VPEVIVMDECPRRLETTDMSTPAASMGAATGASVDSDSRIRGGDASLQASIAANGRRVTSTLPGTPVRRDPAERHAGPPCWSPSAWGCSSPATPAWAHAQLQGTTPAAGSRLAGAPSSITLEFSESVNVTPQGVKVFDARGRRMDLGAAASATAGRDVRRRVAGRLG